MAIIGHQPLFPNHLSSTIPNKSVAMRFAQESASGFIEGDSIWEVSGTQAAVGGLKHIEKYFDLI